MIPPLVAQGRALEAQALEQIGVAWTDYMQREAARKTAPKEIRDALARADGLYWKWLLEPKQQQILARVSGYWSQRVGLSPDDARTLVLVAAHRALLRWDAARGAFVTVLRWWARATLGRGRADERGLSGGRGAATCGRDPTRGLIVQDTVGIGTTTPAIERRPADDTPADVALCLMEYVRHASPAEVALLNLLTSGAGLKEVAQALNISIPAARVKIARLEKTIRAAIT